jgi:hypothetical protein
VLSIEDDDPADPGDRVTLSVSFVNDGKRVDSVNRSVRATGFDRRCVGDGR